jgi:hypothetical protein
VDLFGRQPLVLSVVPLDQVGVDDGSPAQACELAGFLRTLKRADENEGESLLGQRRPYPLGEAAPVVGQGDVRRTRMLPGQAPCRLPGLIKNTFASLLLRLTGGISLPVTGGTAL